VEKIWDFIKANKIPLVVGIVVGIVVGGMIAAT